MLFELTKGILLYLVAIVGSKLLQMSLRDITLRQLTKSPLKKIPCIDSLFPFGSEDKDFKLLYAIRFFARH